MRIHRVNHVGLRPAPKKSPGSYTGVPIAADLNRQVSRKGPACGRQGANRGHGGIPPKGSRTISNLREGKMHAPQGRQDKGHREEVAAFLRTVRSYEGVPIEWLLSLVRATLTSTGRAQRAEAEVEKDTAPRRSNHRRP